MREIVQDSGIADWTVVRASWFNQNFDEGYLPEPVLSGEVALPGGNWGKPFVDADDIADVVSRRLPATVMPARSTRITGPRSLTLPPGRPRRSPP